MQQNAENEGRRTRREVVAAMLASQLVLGEALPALADDATEPKFKYPPINRADKGRCKWASSAMGQSNAARDKLFDLRECDMSKTDASRLDIAGCLMAKGDFSNAQFKEATMSKIFGRGATYDGADFTDAVIDRGDYRGASFRGAIFTNAVLTGSVFEGADLTGADFTEAIVGQIDLKKLCKNPTLKGANPVTGASTRESAGCPS